MSRILHLTSSVVFKKKKKKKKERHNEIVTNDNLLKTIFVGTFLNKKKTTKKQNLDPSE